MNWNNNRASMAAGQPTASMGMSGGDQSQFFTNPAQMQGFSGAPAQQQYRTQSMGNPMTREPLKLKLGDQERGFYSNMFAQVNPEGKREVESQTIV